MKEIIVGSFVCFLENGELTSGYVEEVYPDILGVYIRSEKRNYTKLLSELIGDCVIAKPKEIRRTVIEEEPEVNIVSHQDEEIINLRNKNYKLQKQIEEKDSSAQELGTFVGDTLATVAIGALFFGKKNISQSLNKIVDKLK